MKFSKAKSNAAISSSATIAGGVQSSYPDKHDAKLERKVLRRLDGLFLPLMCSLYLLGFLDRANLGNARVAGLQAKLKITDVQYQLAVTTTYIPYICSELPSNLLMKKIGPRYLLPGLCLLWGIVATLQSKVHTYSGLLACRFFLGLFEGGLFPGIILYFSYFYRPHELQIRVGIVFSGAALSGAFSGLLAAAIIHMNGIRGLYGWQWVFLLEGLLTIIFAICAFFLLPNEPHGVITFTPELADECVRRLRLDKEVDDNTKFNFRTFISVFTDLKIWVVCLSLFCSGTTVYGLAYFTPSIVQGLKFGSTETQLLTVPPFALGCLGTLLSAYIADRYHCRGLTAIASSIIAFIGFTVLYTTSTVAARYTGLNIAVLGVYSAAPSYFTWIPNNTAGHIRRATAIALSLVLTNCGGIVSTWIYPSSGKPYYRFAAKFNMSVSIIPVGLVAFQMYWLSRKNSQKISHRAELLRGLENLTFAEQFDILGDRHPDFKYTL